MTNELTFHKGMMILLAFVGFVIFFIGCTTSEVEAERILREDGFTNIEITGWAPLSCGDNDQYRTGFFAERPVFHEHGRGTIRVEGAVCCNLLMSCVIRY